MSTPLGKKIKVKVEIVLEISSDEFENHETMMDEIATECTYNFPSTDNVTVHDQEWRDTQLL